MESRAGCSLGLGRGPDAFDNLAPIYVFWSIMIISIIMIRIARLKSQFSNEKPSLEVSQLITNLVFSNSQNHWHPLLEDQPVWDE